MLIKTMFILYAGMAELADASDLGSDGQPCRFKSCYPYQQRDAAPDTLPIHGSVILCSLPKIFLLTISQLLNNFITFLSKGNMFFIL